MTIVELYKLCGNCTPDTIIEFYFDSAESGHPDYNGSILSFMGKYTNLCKTKPIKSFFVSDERFDIIEVVI